MIDFHTRTYSDLEALRVLAYTQGYNDAMQGRAKQPYPLGTVAIEHGAYLQGFADGKSLRDRTRM